MDERNSLYFYYGRPFYNGLKEDLYPFPTNVVQKTIRVLAGAALSKVVDYLRLSEKN